MKTLRTLLIALLFLASLLLPACGSKPQPSISAEILQAMDSNCSRLVGKNDVRVIELTNNGATVTTLHEQGEIQENLKIDLSAGEHFIGVTVGDGVKYDSPVIDAKDLKKAVVEEVHESSCPQTTWWHYVLVKPGSMVFHPTK